MNMLVMLHSQRGVVMMLHGGWGAVLFLSKNMVLFVSGHGRILF